MNKELFVSATPHETKVGITEDDQLAEIYLERENEYTLAGSIYKGRVTRVLPGMQSAFVDIGLERDAFLYVSDFMDLEQQDEDLDEAIPANRPMTESRPRNGDGGGAALEAHSGENQSGTGEIGEPQAASSEASGNGSSAARDFRGRGRRGETGDHGGQQRGERPEREEIPTEPATQASSEAISETHNEHRDGSRTESRNEPRSDRFNRGDRSGRGRSDSRSQRPAPTTPHVGRDYDYGPPPGYQPILLPGESISKYQKQSQNQAGARSSLSENAVAERPTSSAIIANFPDDEPIFASTVTEPLHEQHEHVTDGETHEEAYGHMHDDVSSYQQKDDLEVSEESAARERVKRALMTSEAVDEAPVASQQTQDIAREIVH